MAYRIGDRVVEQVIQVLAPRDGYGHGPECVLQYQGPSNDPCYKLAHGGVGIGIGASGDGNHGSKFSITQACERTTYRSDDKGNGDGGSGGFTRGSGGPDEEAGANDRTDPQRHKVGRAQGS